MHMKQRCSILVTSILFTGAVLAQVPQEWSAWRPMINARENGPGASLNYRWRRMDAGGRNVPLEIEIRNPDYKGGKVDRWNLMILYERTIEGAGYQRNGPTRELCYLTCSSADSPDGAKCQWSGTEGAVGTKVLEARVVPAEKPAK